MTKVKQALGLALLLAAVSVVVGCSAPVEESKPLQAGDGSQKPTASGATGAGGAPAAPATDNGK